MLPSRADAAGGTAVKFYELRDNLTGRACRGGIDLGVTAAPALSS